MAKAAKKAAPKKAAGKSGASAAPKKSSASKKSAPAKKSVTAADFDNSNQGPLLEKFFYDSLKDIYYAEKLILKKLPKLQKAATTDELKSAFEQHIGVTQGQVARLDQVFQLIGKRAQAKKCEAMDGIVAEAESVIEDTEKGSMTRDVALIIAGQKVEHYEIASYGGLATLAAVMGNEEVKNLLGQTLDEEKEADTILTQIAENNVNAKAEQEDEGEGNDEEEEEETEE